MIKGFATLVFVILLISIVVQFFGKDPNDV